MNDLDRGPVTVVLTRRARPGAEDEFAAHLATMGEVALTFPGHRGITVLRADDGVFTLVVRFDTQEQLQAWTDSPERAALMVTADRLCISDAAVQQATGLESWFRMPGATLVLPPSRPKMVLTTWLAILPLTELFAVAAAPLLAPLPAWLRPVPVTLLTVTLMTYLVMPALTRLLSGWLRR